MLRVSSGVVVGDGWGTAPAVDPDVVDPDMFAKVRRRQMHDGRGQTKKYKGERSSRAQWNSLAN